MKNSIYFLIKLDITKILVGFEVRGIDSLQKDREFIEDVSQSAGGLFFSILILLGSNPVDEIPKNQDVANPKI